MSCPSFLGDVSLKRKKQSATFAANIKTFYENGDYKTKIRNFVDIIFPELTNIENIRQVVYDKYNNDGFIQILECKYGLRAGGSILKCYSPKDLLPQFVNHQKAAVYAFADYLKENY